MQADVVPFGQDAPADATPAAGVWAGYLPEYGAVRKRRIVTFSCLERKVLPAKH